MFLDRFKLRKGMYLSPVPRVYVLRKNKPGKNKWMLNCNYREF